MEDTDWRPSPCPKCGAMRAAAENPVCWEASCELYGRHLTKAPEGADKLQEPLLSGGNRRVQAFKAGDGSTHPTLEDAVKHDVRHLLEDMDEGGTLFQRHDVVAGYLVDSRCRIRLTKLLNELK